MSYKQSRWKRRNQSSVDFTQRNLPHNRKQVFFDVLSIHWKTFILFGLLFLLLCLPMQGISFLRTLLINEAYGNVPIIDETQKQQLASYIMSLDITSAILLIPCILFLSVSIAGFVKVIRQYSWLENVNFKKDFFSGIKDNIGQMFLLGLIVAIVYVLCIYALNYAQVVNNTWLSILSLVPVGFAIFVGIPICAYAIVCISIYKNKFGQILLTALVCFIKKPLQTLSVLFCCLAIFAVQLIPNFAVMIISKVLLSFFIPFVFLAWYLFALEKLDKAINEKNYPTIVGKGTFSD